MGGVTGKIQRNNYHHGLLIGVFDFHARDASECQKLLSGSSFHNDFYAPNNAVD